jgi:TetR/AcrR family transcriptional regulator, repressor for neighboring sulfatase
VKTAKGIGVDEGKSSRRRGGREQTTASILDAAEKLFAERGFTAVSVRDIAAEAGVSHALVHRYLGSKQDVYRETLARREDVIRDAAPEEGDLLEATRLMLREAVLHQRTYVRLIAHSALHGLSYEKTVGQFAATARLTQLAGQTAADEGAGRDPDAPDPRFVIASLVAMLVGWSAAREWVLRASGLEGMSDEEFFAAFERIALDIERLYFPSLRAGPMGREGDGGG